MSLILASASPRRRMLLEAAGYSIAEICPADIAEERHPGEDPVGYTARLANEKAGRVMRLGFWVLAADTVVHWQDMVLEKPRDAEEAQTMIRMLAGSWHCVTTGWCLAHIGDSVKHVEMQCTSRVRFRDLLESEIAAYVATGEGMDKAGAYGIQGLGATLVAEVKGSYSNVVGLPMEQVSVALQSIGILPRGPS
jgi:septum formation protein